jgi:AcrR family transcriptional regulator
MARARSPDKRIAILCAAVHEIAETGLAASTAKIAGRAGVATGTLFTYFANKKELLNELYFELMLDAYTQDKLKLSTQSRSGAPGDACMGGLYRLVH